MRLLLTLSSLFFIIIYVSAENQPQMAAIVDKDHGQDTMIYICKLLMMVLIGIIALQSYLRFKKSN